MLGSITPLGERGRGSNWWITVTAYVVGSTVAGLALGGALGALGSPLTLSTPARLAALAVVVFAGLALDLHVAGLRLPTIHRQVDEDWRTRYRGWVWGLGFGLQLGLGVVTIVTTSTVYATWAAAALSGSARAGATVGTVFGLARALPVFAVSRVTRPEQVLALDGRLRRLARPARVAAYTAGSAVGAVSLAGAVRW